MLAPLSIHVDIPADLRCPDCGWHVRSHYATGPNERCSMVQAEMRRQEQLKSCERCREIEEERGFGPSHEGSQRCESGSLASGGRNAHCSCDTCF